MANLVLLNLTLFLTVHFCAVHGYAATHMHITHVMLLFHSATTMWLHHVIHLCYACPRVLVDLVQTCTYHMIVYKGQGIDWQPQSDSLGVSPLKWIQSTPSLISSSHRLVESLRQLTCFISCFIRIRLWYSPYPFLTTHICTQASALHIFSKVATRGTHTKSTPQCPSPFIGLSARSSVPFPIWLGNNLTIRTSPGLSSHMGLHSQWESVGKK